MSLELHLDLTLDCGHASVVVVAGVFGVGEAFRVGRNVRVQADAGAAVGQAEAADCRDVNELHPVGDLVTNT